MEMRIVAVKLAAKCILIDQAMHFDKVSLLLHWFYSGPPGCERACSVTAGPPGIPGLPGLPGATGPIGT